MKLKLGFAVLATSFFIGSCGNDEVTFDGSCELDLSGTLQSEDTNLKICTNYNNVLDSRKDEAKSDCEKNAGEDKVVTWSDSQQCVAEGRSAECQFKNIFGETASIFAYAPTMNSILKNICDEEEEATYTELIAQTKHDVALSVVVGDLTYACDEYKGMSSLMYGEFKAQFGDVESVLFEDDKDCKADGKIAQCTGITSDVFDSVTKYFYFSVDADDEAKCTEDGGTWEVL